MRMSRTAAIRRELDALTEELSRLESRQPEPSVGSALKFSRQYEGQVFDYVAFRAQDLEWYVAGPGDEDISGQNWDELLDWMEDGGTDAFHLLAEHPGGRRTIDTKP